MTDTEALAARIEALETRVAHQDRTIEDLNQTITAQWKEIDSLNRRVVRLGDQLQDMRDSAGATGEPEPPPPHY